PREAVTTPASELRRAAPLSGAIQVDDVSFRYPSEPEPTLANVSFTVKPGQCVAVVGASGSGKSTLARLLSGIYQPLSGTIAFDVRWTELAALRAQLGIVTQDTRLFSGTLRDNVALFDPAVPQDDIERACAAACIHESIEAMPMGYDTMLADGGSSLSGGQ